MIRFCMVGLTFSLLFSVNAEAQEIEKSAVWIECGHQKTQSNVDELIPLATGSGVIIGSPDTDPWLLTARHVVDIDPPVNDKEWKTYCRAFPDGPTSSESWVLSKPFFWPDSVRLDAALFALDKVSSNANKRARSICGENITSRMIIAAGYPFLEASGEDGIGPHELGFVGLPGEVHKNLPGSGILLSTHNFIDGMSGGPVFNENGEVIGLVRGKFATQFSTIVPAYRLRQHIKDITNIDEDCSQSEDASEPLVDNKKQQVAECRAAAVRRKTSCRAYGKSGFHSKPNGSCNMTLIAGSGRYFPDSINRVVTVEEENYRRISGPPAVEAMRPQDNIIDGNSLTVAFSGTIRCSNSRGTGRTCESRATVSAVSYPTKCFEIEGELAQ